jgi:hypothetical protein
MGVIILSLPTVSIFKGWWVLRFFEKVFLDNFFFFEAVKAVKAKPLSFWIWHKKSRRTFLADWLSRLSQPSHLKIKRNPRIHPKPPGGI